MQIVPTARINRPQARSSLLAIAAAIAVLGLFPPLPVAAAQLKAGAAKVDITNTDAGPVNDPLYVKALVVADDATTAGIISGDAVAIGEVGRIKDEYLGKVWGGSGKDMWS